MTEQVDGARALAMEISLWADRAESPITQSRRRFGPVGLFIMISIIIPGKFLIWHGEKDDSIIYAKSECYGKSDCRQANQDIYYSHLYASKIELMRSSYPQKQGKQCGSDSASSSLAGRGDALSAGRKWGISWPRIDAGFAFRTNHCSLDKNLLSSGILSIFRATNILTVFIQGHNLICTDDLISPSPPKYVAAGQAAVLAPLFQRKHHLLSFIDEII